MSLRLIGALAALALASCVVKEIRIPEDITSFRVTLVQVLPDFTRPAGCDPAADPNNLGTAACPRPFAPESAPVTVRVSAQALDKDGSPKAWDGLVMVDVRPGRIAGFSFWARSGSSEATMGEILAFRDRVELRISVPQPARLRLLRDGQVVAQAVDSRLAMLSHEPGVYRVEAYRRHAGRERGWIFSNPIYVE